MRKPTSKKAEQAVKMLRQIGMWPAEYLPAGAYWAVKDARVALQSVADHLFEREEEERGDA